MSATDELARRVTVQGAITASTQAAHQTITTTNVPCASDVRRLLALHSAVGDLDSALERGFRDLDHELARIGAVVQVWLEGRAALEARCVCPWQPEVPSEAMVTNPLCPAHGEVAA